MDKEKVFKTLYRCGIGDKQGDCDGCPYQKYLACTKLLMADAYFYIKNLRKEISSYKKRWKCGDNLPCKIGDKLYRVTIVFNDTGLNNGTTHGSQGIKIIEEIVTEKNIYKLCDMVSRGSAFYTPTDAIRAKYELIQKMQGN